MLRNIRFQLVSEHTPFLKNSSTIRIQRSIFSLEGVNSLQPWAVRNRHFLRFYPRVSCLKTIQSGRAVWFFARPSKIFLQLITFVLSIHTVTVFFLFYWNTPYHFAIEIHEFSFQPLPNHLFFPIVDSRFTVQLNRGEYISLPRSRQITFNRIKFVETRN